MLSKSTHQSLTAIDVGRRAGERRRALSLEAKMVAAQIGLSERELLDLEQGLTPTSAEMLVALATALQTEPSWFFRKLGAKS